MSAERVFEILDMAPDLLDGPRGLTRAEVHGAVTFEGVQFGYDSTRLVLKGIDFHAPPGSRVALVGSTGAGKTTFVSLIPRFYDPTGGRILLDGIDVREFQLHALRQQVSMVLQPPLVFPMSVRANITYGQPDATSEQIQRAATLAQLDEFLAHLPQGLDTVVGEGGRPSRLASNSASPSPGRSCVTPRFCCWTNPPPPSMRRPRRVSSKAWRRS